MISVAHHQRGSEQAQGGNQHTIDSRHNETYLGGISSASEVGIDLLRFVLVQGDKSVQDIVAGRSVIRSTFSNIRSMMLPAVVADLVQLAFIIREIVLHGGHREFLLEPVDLVQKQDDRGLDKPSGVADGVEEGESFLHSVYSLVLEEQLIVLRYSNQEKDGRDVLKAVYPFLSFRPLTSNIEHTIGELANDESGFGNASSLHSRS